MEWVLFFKFMLVNGINLDLNGLQLDFVANLPLKELGLFLELVEQDFLIFRCNEIWCDLVILIAI